MSDWGSVTYPVTGLDMAATDLIHTFMGFFVDKLPPGTISKENIFINDKAMAKSKFKNEKDGTTGPVKLSSPKLKVTTSGLSDPFTNENNGPMVNVMNMFPGMTNDRSLVSNHRMGLINDREYAGIVLDTIDIRRKITMRIVFDSSSKSDWNTMKSIIYNSISMKKNNLLRKVHNGIILPSAMVADIAALAFNKGAFDYTNPEHLEVLTHYMRANGFYDFYMKVENDGDPWFIVDRIFNMYYIIRPIEGDEGNVNKTEQIVDDATFEMEVELDFKLPNSYVLNYKKFNIPNNMPIDNSFFTNSFSASVSNVNNPDGSKAGSTNTCIRNHAVASPVYIEDRPAAREVDPDYRLIIREDMTMVDTTDILNITTFISSISKWRVLIEYLTIKEQKSLFIFHIYEDGYYVDDELISIEWLGNEINITVTECDVSKVYTLYIFVNQVKLVRLLKRIEKRIDAGNIINTGITWGINIPQNEVEYLHSIGGDGATGGIPNTNNNIPSRSTIDSFNSIIRCS